MNPKDNASNQPNANKGTPGTNLQYDQAQGNRGKLMAIKSTVKSSGKIGGRGSRRR